MGIPAPAVAARSAARLLVERENLTPPVDVLALLRQRATVQRVDWPDGHVDAIITSMAATAGKPRIFLRATDNPLRERFTAAHELGHLVLPWHLPEADCAANESEGMLDRPRYTLEDEADVFASCLLAPDRWLSGLFEESGHDMGAVIREMNAAEISTAAAIQALRRYLLAGWGFVAYRPRRFYTTSGTILPDGLDFQSGPPTNDDMHHLAQVASENGSSSLNGYSIDWFRFTQSSPLPKKGPGDERSDHEILLASILACGYSKDDSTKISMSANGKVGGALQSAAGRPADELYDSMRHRLDDWQYSSLLSQPDFLLWLAQRCRAIQQRSRDR